MLQANIFYFHNWIDPLLLWCFTARAMLIHLIYLNEQGGQAPPPSGATD